MSGATVSVSRAAGLFGGWVVSRAAADWVAVHGEDWPARVMDAPVTDRFHAKQGRSIGRVFAGPLRYYLKRFHTLPRLTGWLAKLWPGRLSPGLHEWHNLELARDAGLPVPRPLAAAEWGTAAGGLQACLAVEELVDMLPLHQLIPLASRTLPPALFAEWKRGLVRELARLCRLLHGRDLFHKDLYFCHFYAPEALARTPPTSWASAVYAIDFHRLGRHPVSSAWWLVKDLGQLLYSSEVEGVTARDRLRFWKHYRRGWRWWLPASWARAAVLLRLRRYRDHNQKRRQRSRPCA